MTDPELELAVIVTPEIELNLALAVITSSHSPLILLDDTLTVLAASRSFDRAFGLDPDNIKGRPLASLGAGEWAVPQLSSLLRATVAGSAEIEAYEFDLKRKGQAVRRLILNAQKLVYRDQDHARLLVAIVDVTEARINEKLKDDLLREKAILLQELQHRVANSLQIIASVLLQSARRVQSDETRRPPLLRPQPGDVGGFGAKAARVVALGSVNLRSYLIELCESLGASMIHDHEQIKLVVDSDDVSTNADISLSLGLIVTELVINALKHAFPASAQARSLSPTTARTTIGHSQLLTRASGSRLTRKAPNPAWEPSLSRHWPNRAERGWSGQIISLARLSRSSTPLQMELRKASMLVVPYKASQGMQNLTELVAGLTSS